MAPERHNRSVFLTVISSLFVGRLVAEDRLPIRYPTAPFGCLPNGDNTEPRRNYGSAAQRNVLMNLIHNVI
jgi:hypothetical protein